MTPADSSARAVRASVYAPARLHLGFLDPSGGDGRRFGSLGLTLEGIGVRVTAERDERLAAVGEGADRLLAHVRALERELGVEIPLRFDIRSAIPEHAGLGSGTQLALVAGRLVAACCGIALSTRRAAQILDRGNRSGIGIGAFETGGFLVDGGRGPNGSPPPIVSRLPFPPLWRVILMLDTERRGLSGDVEAAAFRRAEPFPSRESERLCKLVLMKALPALAECDLAEFGAAIGELQRTVGDHFAPAQGGRYASAAVATAIDSLERQGVTGVGQSSWGPTGFALVDSETRAASLIRSLRALPGCAGLEFAVVKGRDRGAEIDTETAAARASGT